MERDQRNRFLFSKQCYFDLESNTIVETDRGKVIQNTPISGASRSVLRKLIQVYPGSVSKEQLCMEISASCDEAEVRRIIDKLRKRHPQLSAWLPRARDGEYRLLKPAAQDEPEPSPSPAPQKQSCTLKSTGICVRPNFVREARSDVFAQLDEAFQESHVVFLQGIGGIGKSEAAKHWALQKKKERLFDTVVFAQLNSETNNSSVQSLVADDTIFVISGPFRGRDENESAEDYFHRKLAKIMQITDERTLIVVDNYDIDDPQLAALFAGSHRLLVTTRNRQSGYDFPLIPVTEIREIEHLKRIFFKNLSGERDDIEPEDPYIERLFTLVSNHTLTIEIIAKSLVNSADTPESLYRKIGDPEQHTLMRHVDGLVDRNFSEEPLTPFACIRVLFNLSRLEQDKDFEYKSQVLTFLAAMPTRGIELSLFKKWSDSRIIRAKNSLVRKSWLRQDSVKGTTLISMHPLIREIVWHELEPTPEKCASIISQFNDANCQYSDNLYHKPKKDKDQLERIALSLLSAFPPQDLNNFDFYCRIQGILSSCANSEAALQLAYEMKRLFDALDQTSTWQYGFVNFRIGAAYGSLYRERVKAMDYLLLSERIMESTAHTDVEKMWLICLYREIACIDCQDKYLFTSHDERYIDSIEERLNKGEALASRLMQSGFRNITIDLYHGTVCVWRSKVEIYRGNLDKATALINTADAEFTRLGYINALDESAVEDVRALIHAAKKEYSEEIECLHNAIRIFLGGFGFYHRTSLERAIRLATAYQNNNQPDEAIRVLSHYLKVALEMLGHDAPMTIGIRSQLEQLRRASA